MYDYQRISRIVTDVKGGNQNAFTSLFELFQPEFYFFAYKNVHERSAAEDITQNTFIKIFNSIGKLDDPSTFVKWAYTILRRQCSKHFRKTHDVLLSEDGEGLFDTVENDQDEFLPGSILETQETRDAIVELISELPEEQRSAIMLHYYKQMSIADISEVVGCPANTVKTRLGYARKKIKARIKDYEKMGVTMLGVVPLPILTRILLDAAEQSRLAPEAVQGMWEGVGQATGISAPLPSGASTPPAGSSGATVTPDTPVTAAATASHTVKTIKVIVAVLLLGTIGAAAYLMLRTNEVPAAAIVETSPSPSPSAELITPQPEKTLTIIIPDHTPTITATLTATSSPTIPPTQTPTPNPTPKPTPTPTLRPSLPIATPIPTIAATPTPAPTPTESPAQSLVFIGIAGNPDVGISSQLYINLSGGGSDATIINVNSSNPGILEIESSYGALFAKGISPGVVTITAFASDGGVGTLTVSVNDPYIAPTTAPLSLNITRDSVLTDYFQATASGGVAPYTFSTDNPNGLNLHPDGFIVVTAPSPSGATIIVTDAAGNTQTAYISW